MTDDDAERFNINMPTTGLSARRRPPPATIIRVTVSTAPSSVDDRTSRFAAPAANSLPTGADKTITINEDTAHAFAAADFGYSDTDGDTLASITIVTLPGAGTLSLGSDAAHDADTTYTAVAADDDVAAADIGKLRYVPAADGQRHGLCELHLHGQ